MVLRQLPLSGLIPKGTAMINYAGWSMPLHYGSVLEETLACRHTSVLFDVSHMLQSRISDYLLLQTRFRCQLPDKPWQSKLCLWLNEAGGIEDDMILTKTANEWRMVSNAATRDKVMGAFGVEEEEEEAVLLALQGPESEQILCKLGIPVSSLPFMHSLQHGNVLVTRCGYTGEDGFELSIPAAEAMEWATCLSSHSRWAGLGARDILRIEAGLRLYGQEMRPDLTPADAGLSWLVTKPWKGNARYRLVGWRTKGRMVKSGTNGITSACWSPHFQCPIGMALLPLTANLGQLEDGRVLETVKLPFIPHRFKKKEL